jgi:hypothetical protein
MEAISVIMEDKRPRVKNVVEAVYASTEGERPRVKNAVEVVEFVFTARSSITALNANGSKGELISLF